MKKLSAFFLLCLITVALTACGKPADAAPDSISTDTTGSAAQTPTATAGRGTGEDDADPNTRSFRDCTVSVVGYSLRKDENNDTALCVEYEFENNSKSSASFSTTVLPYAYQPEENKSITCAAYNKLNTETLPVTLQKRDLRDSTAKALTRTLDLTGLTIESTADTEPDGSAAS